MTCRPALALEGRLETLQGAINREALVAIAIALFALVAPTLQLFVTAIARLLAITLSFALFVTPKSPNALLLLLFANGS